MEIRLLLLIWGFFFCFIGLAPQYSNAQRSSITQGEQLHDGEYLVSAREIFILGFFSPALSKQRYLGIWYKGDPNNIAWVANRHTPIFDSSGVLTIDADGGLKITYNGVSPSDLSYPSNQTARNATATLLDSGNFVISELNSNGSGSRVLWQSFDYPTDTLLPGMKLGLNVKTGHKWSLTSWMSEDVPASGAFTLGSDPNGTAQLFVWRRGKVHWKSGLLLNNKSFEFYPSFGRDDYSYGYNFSYVSNGDEKYFTYSATEGDTLVKLVMGILGEIMRGRGTAGPFNICDYNQPQCVGLTLPKCRRFHDRFVGQNGFMKGEPYQNEGDPNMTLAECREKCWTNCSCTAYASANYNGTGCQFWNRGIEFTYLLGASRSINVLDSFDSFGGFRVRRRGRPFWFVIVVVPLLAIIICAAICYLVRRKLRQKGNEASQENILLELGGNNSPPDNFMENGDNRSHDVKIFHLASILAATNNFTPENRLGQGGFGPVYKGKLLNGQEIAVKRLSRSSGQGLVEFKNEIVLIAKLQHMNLVRLLGCCIEGEEKMLIYEYMPNKSLDFFLFHPVRKELLDWKRRVNIIEGIAQGLLYLHKYSRLRVIHRDLKASNVLLDSEMNPKISDFGMARISGQNESEANTNRVVGTYGYMSPEYAMEGIFSVKFDVFSFGVLLLEIVSGRKNSSFYHFERPLNLIGYTWELWREGKSSELLDPSLVASCQQNQPFRLIHLGLLCVQEYAADRPNMSDVVSMLGGTIPLPPPKQPAFFVGRSMTQADTASRKTEKCSINGVSISTMDAR